MKKHVAGLCAALVIAGGFGSVHTVSAASAAGTVPTTTKKTTQTVGTTKKESYAPSQSVSDTNESVSGTVQNTNNDKSTNTTNDAGNGTTGEATNGTNAGGDSTSQPSSQIDKVIDDGMKYVGTPYVFGSDRNDPSSFDCSDFTRWIFKETLGVVLPADSRQQGAYVKDLGNEVTDIKDLKRGDLVFFMSYKGSKESNYNNVDKSVARITHVAIYLGDGKLLHTYSNESGGVHVGDFSGQWQYRFLFGGSVLKK
ncbi:C40 family peptidase [Cohnella soli]|uniref:C40 family peptidase n=1 Tax=Cohnella soli TaxID=425005 RepID=A0ABW0HRE5_9BACL